jgi:hypothetical protein
MANDLDYFGKQTSKNYADSEAAAIQAAKDANKANIQLIKDNYGTQIADAKAAYDPYFRQNEIQRAVNERYLERRAAEMGLTDSGLSRTQQTANQLSYGNQNAEYVRKRQKAVDTLKAAMDAKILKQNTDLNTNIAGIKTTYADKRTADAVSLYKKYIEKSTEAATTTDDQFNDLYNQIYKEKADLNKDFSNMNSPNYGKVVTSPVHDDMIYKYQKQNGLLTDSIQMKMLLNAAGISEREYIGKYGTIDEANAYIANNGGLDKFKTKKAEQIAEFLENKPAKERTSENIVIFLQTLIDRGNLDLFSAAYIANKLGISV